MMTARQRLEAGKIGLVTWGWCGSIWEMAQEYAEDQGLPVGEVHCVMVEAVDYFRAQTAEENDDE